ncbi:MAG TPA: helix-turn-helix transcriptional regulator [Acidimicrobiales bacterium]|nr:helix-turn-helix transcriptional regulator [Acidimicrobiales bacterium]
MVEPAAPNYSIKVGERLRAVRKELRLSLQAVESQSNQEFKASVLGAYERGERAISVLRLQRLANFYGVAVDRLLPPAHEVSDEDADASVTIDLRTVAGEAGELRPLAGAAGSDLITRFIALVRTRRRDSDAPLALRSEDVSTLAGLLGISADEVRRRVGDLVAATA